MFQERNRLLVKHEQLRAKKREKKKKHRKSKERGKGEQPGMSRAQSEEKERGHHDGRRRHREKGVHTIRKDSASPRTRIHKVKDDISCLKLTLYITACKQLLGEYGRGASKVVLPAKSCPRQGWNRMNITTRTFFQEKMSLFRATIKSYPEAG